MLSLVTKSIKYIALGLGVVTLLVIFGGIYIFNTFIKPNVSPLNTQIESTVSEISQPLVQEGEQIVQDTIEQGKEEAQGVISEIMKSNLEAIRESIISSFTIGEDSESESE
jgi:predicted PurR-regulated permease PerM